MISHFKCIYFIENFSKCLFFILFFFFLLQMRLFRLGFGRWNHHWSEDLIHKIDLQAFPYIEVSISISCIRLSTSREGVQQPIVCLCVSLGHAHQSVSDLVPEKTRGVLGRLWGCSACAPQKITGVEPLTAAIADLTCQIGGSGKRGARHGGPRHSQPGVTEGWRPDPRRKRRAESLLLNFSLTSPVCRCNLSVIPSVPVIPPFFYCGVSSRGDYNDNLVNADEME